MDQNSIELLEFELIRNECSSLCLGPEGRRQLAEQSFETDPNRLDRLLTPVCDFRTILTRADGIPSVTYPEVSFLSILEKEGRVLEGEQLAALGLFIRSGVRLKEFLVSQHEELSQLSGTLKDLVLALPEVKEVERIIFKELDKTGDVREDHPALAKIRSKLRNLHARLNAESGSVMKENASLWQMEGPVMREGRVVLPLKADYRGRIRGIIHETSASGNTIYIEPFEMVELNNEKAVQESAYKNLIHTVVRGISDRIRPFFYNLVGFVEQVGYIDTLYARARYGMIHDCSRARLSGGEVGLNQARHPHLGSRAVPIEVHLSGDTRAMIITGPNAGGKTVTLKTLGLLAMMNQFGLEIPAGEGSVLPVYDDIYADIGDDQSISASLSTFSGHMKRIASVLRYATADSLILLDELGAGTDPAEGSALGMAVLDTFINLGATVVVTTHHGVMKQFAYTRPGVMNASLAFDQDTLMPTYRVIEGLPGESHALEIAVKSGITEEVATRARTLMEDRKGDISSAVEELEKRKRNLMSAEDEFRRKEMDLREQKRSHDLNVLRVRQKEKELKEKEQLETNRFIRESRKELENLIREIREGELTREKTRKAKEFSVSLERRAEEEERKISELAEATAVQTDYEPAEGDEVMVSGKRGTVIRREKAGTFLVHIGSLRMSVSPEDMTPVRAGNGEKKVSVSYAGSLGGSKAEYEVDLRGMRLDEALLHLEKQVDSAVLTGLSIFNIIHGTGEGILRRGVHDFLKHCPAVKDYEFSHPAEGGFGKTIVRLKQS